MISRVAECCFWMLRYLERIDNIGRLLEVNLSFVLDSGLPELERWRPLLVVSGEEERFLELYGAGGAENAETVQEYLIWEEKNPVSVHSSTYWARENARTIRETISLEMWEVINGFWLWLKGKAARKLYDRDRRDFCVKLKEMSQLFRGVSHDTMLHEEPFDFMRLGMLLERGGQTARILDVKHYMLKPTRATRRILSQGSGGSGAAEIAQWTSVLRSCSATESYLKRIPVLSGPGVARFLLLEESFPRSILHCLTRSENFLGRILGRGPAWPPPTSLPKVAALLSDLRSPKLEEEIEGDLHGALTRIIEASAGVSMAVHNDFFDPKIDGVFAEAGPG